MPAAWVRCTRHRPAAWPCRRGQNPDPGLAADAAALARFDRENRTIAALSHPNILAVYDVGQHGGGIPYAVLELLEGETLRVTLDRAPVGRRDHSQLRETDCGRGLAAAQAKDIVHRELEAGQHLRHLVRHREDPRLRSRARVRPQTTAKRGSAQRVQALSSVLQRISRRNRLAASR